MSKLLSLQLELSFEPPFGETVDAMLDDITFEYCTEGDVPEDSDQLSCDFEKMNTCSWYHDHTASMLWEIEADKPNGECILFNFICF